MPDDTTQELIDYFSTFVEQELKRQFGEDKAIPLHKLYDRQFKIHYNNYKHMMPDELSRRHGINSIAIIALDEVMMEVRASFSQLRDTVISIYRMMLTDYFETEVQEMKESDDKWNAFIEWARKGNKTNYDNRFFDLYEADCGENCFGFDIGKCLYFDIFKEAGRTELGPILCEYDGIFADFVKDWIEFKRFETIASGDKFCTFRYHRM